MALEVGALRINIETNTKAVRELSKDMKALTAIVRKQAETQTRSASAVSKALKGQVDSTKNVSKAQKEVKRTTEQAAAAALRQERALATARNKAQDLIQKLKQFKGTEVDIQKVNSRLGTFVSSIRKANGDTTKLSSSMLKFNQATRPASQNLAKLNRELRKVKETKADEALKRVNLSTQDLTKSVQLALGPLSGVASRITALAGIFNKQALAMTAAIAGLVGFLVLMVKVIKAATEFETQILRLNFQVASMGANFRLSARELNRFAVELGEATLASAGGVRDAIGVLLTFRDINQDVFKRTVAAAQDLVTTFGGDLPSATRRLARAMVDPTTGLEALTRTGIVFSDQQKQLIQALVFLERSFEAQEIILKKVEGQMGGNSLAAAAGLAGAFDNVKERVTRFFEQAAKAGGILAPLTRLLNRTAEALADVIEDQRRMSQIGSVLGATIKGIAAAFTFVIDNAAAFKRILIVLAGAAAIGLVFSALANLGTIVGTVGSTFGTLAKFVAKHPLIAGAVFIAAKLGLVTSAFDNLLEKGQKIAKEQFGIDLAKSIETFKTDFAKLLSGIKSGLNFVLPTPQVDPFEGVLVPGRTSRGEEVAKEAEALAKNSKALRENNEEVRKRKQIVEEAAEKTRQITAAQKAFSAGLSVEKEQYEIITPLLQQQTEQLKSLIEQREKLGKGKFGASEKDFEKALRGIKLSFRLARDAAEGFLITQFTVSSSIRGTAAAARETNKELRNLFIAYREGTLAVEEYNKQSLEVMDTFVAIQDAQRGFAQIVANSFAQAAIEGGKLRNVIADIGKALFQAAIQAAIFRAIAGIAIGGAAGGGSDLSGGGPRPGGGVAAGGPVVRNRAFIVGEQGPELFTPSQSGRILPNGSLPGGGGNTVIQNFDFRQATPGMEARVAAAIRAGDRAAVTAASRTATDTRLRS